MKICSKCFETICKCKNKKLFECDELMMFVIKTLNQKGYKTSYCCQGHIISYKWPILKTYIIFNKIYNFNVKPKRFLLANETEPWKKGCRKRSFVTHKVDNPQLSYEDQMKIIFKNHDALVKWVKKLK